MKYLKNIKKAKLEIIFSEMLKICANYSEINEEKIKIRLDDLLNKGLLNSNNGFYIYIY
jgi:hypothetical protein